MSATFDDIKYLIMSRKYDVNRQGFLTRKPSVLIRNPWRLTSYFHGIIKLLQSIKVADIPS